MTLGYDAYLNTLCLFKFYINGKPEFKCTYYVVVRAIGLQVIFHLFYFTLVHNQTHVDVFKKS